MDIQLKKASPGDAALIAELAERIWLAHYVPIIGPAQVDYMLRLMYSPQALRQQMDEGHEFHVVLLDGRPAGYLSLSQKTPGEFFLHKFYIETAEQGKGFGAEVFRKVLQLYPGMRSMRLTVNRKNFKSINFYFKLGFRIEEVKDFDIGEGYFMEDFVMVKMIAGI